MDGIDKLNRYREILKQAIEHQATFKASDRQIESVPICDPVHGHYLLMSLGWDHVGRAHDILIHLRLKDGKVRIEWDGIEEGIFNDLVKAGISEEDIIFAGRNEDVELLSELAAA